MNVSWSDVENIMRNIFQDSDIKIIICTNSIRYVRVEERNKIFSEFHDTLTGGPEGINKTYDTIREKYFWENLKTDIQNRVNKCELCQRNRLKRIKTRQPLQITDTPLRALQKISMDIMGPLKETANGNKYILVIQDQLSGFSILVALKDQTAETIADQFIKKFICIFGSPALCLIDRGGNFCSRLIRAIAKRFRIKKIETTAFSPRSNGKNISPYMNF